MCLWFTLVHWSLSRLLLLSLISSERMVDDAISIAMATKENLTGQRHMFMGVTSKMQNITRILPESPPMHTILYMWQCCEESHSDPRHVGLSYRIWPPLN